MKENYRRDEFQDPQMIQSGGVQVQELASVRTFHPVACLFHVTFKLVAVLAYLFLGLFANKNITVFITVLLCQCLDFWLTKNVTGRYLIGLRWWSASEISAEEGLEDENEAEETDEPKEDSWHFEFYTNKVVNSQFDSSIFWVSQAASAIFWSVFLVIKVIGLSLFWGMLVFICASLSVLNLYAFYLCNKDHDDKMRNAFTQIIRASMQALKRPNQQQEDQPYK